MKMRKRQLQPTTALERDVRPILLPILLAAFMAAVFAAVAEGAEATAQDTVDFSGSWELNEELSDDARETMRAAMGARGGRGGQGTPPADGEGRGGPGRGGRGMGPLALGPVMSATQLMIEQSGQELVFRGERGAPRTIVVGESEAATDEPEASATVAYWDGPWLMIETGGTPGPRTAERYELVGEGTRLVVTVQLTLPGDDEPVEIHRVFDAAAK